MKTQHSNMGLGESGKKRRGRNFDKRGWRFKRAAYVQRNLRYAVVAKSFRLVHEVTQSEVGVAFGVTATSVCSWESGKYGWRGGQEELDQYLAVIRAISNASS